MKIVVKSNIEKWPVSEEDIVALEARIKHDLPADYRAFLLRTNGGQTGRNTFSIPDQDERSSCVTFFYGLNLPKSGMSFDRVVEFFKDLFSRGYLPVADTAFGDQIVISLRGKNTGCVYFWDHEVPGLTRSLTLLADSFESFMDECLRGEPEVVDPTEDAELAGIVLRDDVEALRARLDSGLDPDRYVTKGIKLILRAVSNDATACIALLCERGADAKHAFERALNLVKDEMAAMLLRTGRAGDPANPGPYDDWLHHTAFKGMLETTNVLLEMGYPVNRFESRSGFSPLACCARKPNSEVYKLIKQYGGEELYRDADDS